MSKSRRQLYLEKELNKEMEKQENKAIIGIANKYKKELEVKATNAEKLMIEILKNSPLATVFNFQQIIYIKYKNKIKNFYIADFCIPIKKIILEIDGEYHFDYNQKIKDKERTANLKKLGYKVIRATNKEVTNNGKEILRKLIRECNLR